MCKLTVSKFVTDFGSNAYVINDVGSLDSVIVDPGSISNYSFFEQVNKRNIVAVCLTHHHFDHIYNLANIPNINNLPIYSGKVTRSIFDNSYNLSKYKNVSPVPRINKTMINALGKISISLKNSELLILPTPGHTESSVCLISNGFMFTGDTLIFERKTITNLPTGNRFVFYKTLDHLFTEYFGQDLLVMPGHGMSFRFDSVSKEMFI